MGVIDNLGKKLDSRKMGVIFGVGLTIIGFVVFWQWKHGQKSLGELYHHLYSSPNNRSDLLIFSVIPNLLLFYFTNFQWRWDKFTTGLVTVTIVLTVIIALLILL
ncbi:hypothetical protein ERX46_16010 [Brumimicrobium glaciale]|uniref:Uncharacterized protein n=1 Tax=Brumimicrobium glaciale TaxID=200475 RepID=A0A4Q4KGJ6_9FLAO|nr:hypothetical protein [Brumimicrobium glaciale]RYM32185.1 hypothetical protein ERX46_16010 [Brumimicrobium glaciale]